MITSTPTVAPASDFRNAFEELWSEAEKMAELQRFCPHVHRDMIAGVTFCDDCLQVL